MMVPKSPKELYVNLLAGFTFTAIVIPLIFVAT